MQRARREVLRFFNASAQEYSVIFTPNASGALRLVGESYPFGPDGRYVQLLDNHNSVNGLREFARGKGANIRLVRITPPEMRADAADLTDALADYSDAPHLFAYPAQSNFTGVQHSLDWIAQAQAKGWDVMLDAAALRPQTYLILPSTNPTL